MHGSVIGMAATIAVVSGIMKAGDHCVITNCSCVLALPSIAQLPCSCMTARAQKKIFGSHSIMMPNSLVTLALPNPSPVPLLYPIEGPTY